MILIGGHCVPFKGCVICLYFFYDCWLCEKVMYNKFEICLVFIVFVVCGGFYLLLKLKDWMVGIINKWGVFVWIIGKNVEDGNSIQFFKILL